MILFSVQRRVSYVSKKKKDSVTWAQREKPYSYSDVQFRFFVICFGTKGSEKSCNFASPLLKVNAFYRIHWSSALAIIYLFLYLQGLFTLNMAH